MKKEKASKEQQELLEKVEKATTENTTDNSLVANEKSRPSTFISVRFGIITIILAIAGIIISIDSLVKVEEWHTGLSSFKEQIEKHLEIEQQRLSNLEKSLHNIADRQQIFDKQLNEYHSVLSTVSPLLKKYSERQSVDVLWQLHKAYNWLEEAQLDLRWNTDWQGALLLLEAANDTIAALKIAELEPIHTTLSADITHLLAVHPLNETILLEKIKNISNGIVSLPVPPVTQPPQSKKSSEGKNMSGWRGALSSTFEWIQQVVTIKSNDPSNHSAEPLSDAQSRKILNENIIIALQQTQWALLKKDSVLFHWSMGQVTQMIKNNGALINLNDPKTIKVLQELTLLSQENLTPSFPDIQPVCQQLKTYMDTHENTFGPSSEKVK